MIDPADQPPRRVVIVAFDGVQALDLIGPSEVFAMANRDRRRYRIAIAAREQVVAASSGVQLIPDLRLGRAGPPIDTLIVAGGGGNRVVDPDAALITWLRRSSRRARRVASVCTGAFLLAHAGILDGRRATTHWAFCEELARTFPEVDVQPDPIYVRDGDVWTSAGVSAGIDLALALLEDDHGPELAASVARDLVLFVRRPGGQAQFSRSLRADTATRPGIRQLQAWVVDHLDEDLSVAALAERACMSPRHFARLFADEVGLTPAAYIAEVRVERACQLLERTDHPVDDVARLSGFRTVEALRRTFARQLHVSPSDYRSRFALVGHHPVTGVHPPVEAAPPRVPSGG